MSDLVERLGQHEQKSAKQGYWSMTARELMRESKTEITRLQEAKRRFSDLADERGKESNALRQENERLRAALKEALEMSRDVSSEDGGELLEALCKRALEQKGD